MAKKLERTPIATERTARSRAVADVAAPTPAAEDAATRTRERRFTCKLREEVEQKLLDLGRARRKRCVSFSGFVEAALREALAGNPAALVDRRDARARRRAR